MPKEASAAGLSGLDSGNSITSLLISVAMLTFPIWGVGLIGWLAKASGAPRLIEPLLFLAIFSPLPILWSKSLGGLAKIALVIVYFWIAVPVAIFSLLAVVGQA